MLHDGGILHVGILCDIPCHIVVEEVMLAAFESIGEGFEDEVVVEDGVELFTFKGNGKVLSISPGERVFDGF